mgnify:CR=1 FL=1
MDPFVYDPEETVRTVRSRYWRHNDFGEDGGESKKWEFFPIGPISIPIPNLEGRKKAIRYHDLHHVMTGYQTDFIGELEIASWEIGAGCGKMWFAWAINLQGLMLGFLCNPRRCARAWARGRRSRSLYDRTVDDSLLDMKVGELRAQTDMPDPSLVPTGADWLSYGLTAGLGIVLEVALLVALVVGLWSLVAS